MRACVQPYALYDERDGMKVIDGSKQVNDTNWTRLRAQLIIDAINEAAADRCST